MTVDYIELNDIGSESVVRLGGRMTIAVYVAALDQATWNSGVLTLEVSPTGSEWFSAVTLNGSAPETLTGDGFTDDIYVGEMEYARLRATTAASTGTKLEVHWP